MQELNDERLDEVAGGIAQEDSWDDPRERNHSNKKDDPKDALPQCPVCGSYAISVFPMPGCVGMTRRVCHDCGWERNCTPIG